MKYSFLSLSHFPTSCCQAEGVETELHVEAGSMAAKIFPPPGELLTGHFQAQFNLLHQLENEI